MSNRPAKIAKRHGLRKETASGGTRKETPGGRIDKDCHLRDQRLVDRCLAGEVAAWEELYAQCHPPLLVSIRILLGHGQLDEDLVDEIAAQVWYTLVANDGELLAKYEAARGARLVTFVRTIAKDMVSRHFRSERRRLQREKEALVERPQHHTAGVGQSVASLRAFLATLSPLERSFCGDYLLASPSESEDQTERTYSAANVRQLSSRIHSKLLDFVKTES